MLEKLKEIIADQLSVDESEIELSTSFKDDLGADSWIFMSLLWLWKRSMVVRSLQMT